VLVESDHGVTVQSRRRLGDMITRYLAVGALGFGLNLAVTAGLVEILGSDPALAAGAGIIIVMTVNFALARYAIFDGAYGRWLSQLWKFVSVAIVMRALEYGAFLTLMKIGNLHYILALTAALVMSNLLKFLAYRGWVFSAATANRLQPFND
jgi:putative flippase GtrA